MQEPRASVKWRRENIFRGRNAGTHLKDPFCNAVTHWFEDRHNRHASHTWPQLRAALEQQDLAPSPSVTQPQRQTRVHAKGGTFAALRLAGLSTNTSKIRRTLAKVSWSPSTLLIAAMKSPKTRPDSKVGISSEQIIAKRFGYFLSRFKVSMADFICLVVILSMRLLSAALKASRRSWRQRARFGCGRRKRYPAGLRRPKGAILETLVPPGRPRDMRGRCWLAAWLGEQATRSRGLPKRP